jgi:hypothetical protein
MGQTRSPRDRYTDFLEGLRPPEFWFFFVLRANHNIYFLYQVTNSEKHTENPVFIIFVLKNWSEFRFSWKYDWEWNNRLELDTDM